ncbi:hypothetical protein [uncultured Rikenella sp.]|uniref:hypothetical protein n=1 Tax=uncultured Rikenella sp. TaxID=368003 RepID=UPI00272C9BDF|nr:hypothetical protein [uncultured Rikenella sp.]
MKRFFLAIAAVAALVACSGKTGIEKELVGAYDAKMEVVLPDSTDAAAAEMAEAVVTQMKVEMDFKSDGKVTMVMNGQQHGGTWEMQADSSLVIVDPSGTLNFKVTKTDDGFKLTGDEMSFALTPKK